MSFNMNNFPPSFEGMDHLVRAKALDLANTSREDRLFDDDEENDKDEFLLNSLTEAEEWFENATEEEKEELRKRYPEDLDVKD